MTTCTSTAGTLGGGSAMSGSAVLKTYGPTPTTTAMSTEGTTGGAGRGGSGGTSTAGAGAVGGDAVASTAGITVADADTGAASAPDCVAVPRAGGAPTAASHVQFHVQFHAHSRGVWLSICVESDVVVPQNVNVQLQDQGLFDGAASVVPTSPAASPAAVVLCVTGPLSPGLRTRTDTFVLPTSAAEDDSRLELFGLVAPASVLIHAQSQAQSHVQSSDALLPVSVDDDVARPAQSIANTQCQFHGSDGDPLSD
jgi:hypothetical protein